MKFKIGDVVEFNRDYHLGYWPKGEKMVVTGYEKPYVQVERLVKSDSKNNAGGWEEHWFDLVKPERKFKVGDRVKLNHDRYRKNDSGHGRLNQPEYLIESIYKDCGFTCEGYHDSYECSYSSFVTDRVVFDGNELILVVDEEYYIYDYEKNYIHDKYHVTEKDALEEVNKHLYKSSKFYIFKKTKTVTTLTKLEEIHQAVIV